MTRDRTRKFERIQINELIKTEDRFRYLLHKSYLSKNLPKKERHPLPFSKTLTGVLSLFHVAMKYLVNSTIIIGCTKCNMMELFILVSGFRYYGLSPTSKPGSQEPWRAFSTRDFSTLRRVNTHANKLRR